MRIPSKPPSLSELFPKDPQAIQRFIQVVTTTTADPAGQYRHWDTLRHLTPPGDLTHREWWAAIKFARSSQRRQLPLLDNNGHPFGYVLPDVALEMLHAIDRDASGQLATPDPIASTQTRDRYVQSSLIEEAITSSQLEGAATTREVAKDMIRSGRDPIDRSEQMILNNYVAMKLVSRLSKEPLSVDLIAELFRTITDGALDPSLHERGFRIPGDGIAVYDRRDNTLLHAPPLPETIPLRMQRMCEFANSRKSGAFLHPVIRAIVLHFWLAYDHPFVDGNGRTARALFYWSMLSEGFWLAEFLSVSSILRKAPAQYARAFLYTETDENDLTYFILYHLRVILRAIQGLRAYLDRKVTEVREIERLLRSRVTLNHRQLAVLSHALRHPGMRYTIESHQTSHKVAYQTARTDLLDLARRGLLDQMKFGRAFVFGAPEDLSERLKHLTE